MDYTGRRITWPTPKARDWKTASKSAPSNTDLPDEVFKRANAPQTRSGESVSPLWDDNDQEAFWWPPRGPRCLPPQSLLQQGLHGISLCQRHVAAQLQTETDQPLPWPELRELWNHDDAARPPHRQRLEQRLVEEHPDLMRELSRHSPPPCQACWFDGSWEDGITRIASGVPRRVDRLRGLGNAVVPQVAEWVGRRIIAGLGR